MLGNSLNLLAAEVAEGISRDMTAFSHREPTAGNLAADPEGCRVSAVYENPHG